MTKLYKNLAWLKFKFEHQRMTKEEIAKICGVEPMTIYRSLVEFGLIKNTRSRKKQ